MDDIEGIVREFVHPTTRNTMRTTNWHANKEADGVALRESTLLDSCRRDTLRSRTI